MRADEIREYVNDEYVLPARARGERHVVIRAGDVSKAMRLKTGGEVEVCDALGTNKFEANYRVRRLSIEGPLGGATCVLTFEVLP